MAVSFQITSSTSFGDQLRDFRLRCSGRPLASQLGSKHGCRGSARLVIEAIDLPHKPLKTMCDVSELMEETINSDSSRLTRSSFREYYWIS